MNRGRFAMTFVMLVIFVVMVGMALEYPPESRFMPLLVGVPAIALCLLQLFLDFRAARTATGETPADARSAVEKAQEEISRIAGREIEFDAADAPPPAAEAALDSGTMRRRELIVWGYFLGLVGGILLFGFLATIPIFIVVFLRQWAKTSWRFALGLAAAASAVFYVIFVEGLRIVLHPGFVTGFLLERLAG